MTESLLVHGGLRTLGWSLLATVWQAGLILGGLRLVLRLVPVVQCRTRYRVALASGALVLLFAVATAAWLLGGWRVHSRCWSTDTEWVQTHGAVCQSHGRSQVLVGSGDAVPAAASVDRVVRGVVPVAGVVPSSVLRAVRRMTSLGGLLSLVWVAGLAITLVHTLVDLTRLRGARKRSKPVTDASALAAFDRVRRELGVRASVTLRSSDSVFSPGIAGWRRPTVILPTGLVRVLDARQLRYLFAHELAHAVGRDYPTGLVQLVGERVFFFNPFVRRISRIISDEREALRDRMAVSTGSARGYADMLLSLEGWRALSRPAAGLVGRGGEGALVARVRRLVDAEPGFVSRGRILQSSMVVALLLVLLAQTTSLGGALGSWAVMSLDTEAPSATTAEGPPEPRLITLDDRQG